MKYNCCCHLKLKGIGHFLHATDELASDRVRLIGTSPILHREDGFAVIQVEEDRVESIGRAVNIRACLQRFLKVLALPDSHLRMRQTIFDYSFVLKMIKDAADMCEGGNVMWQHMLRKAQVLALVTEVTERMKDKLACGSQHVTASSLEVVTFIFEAAHALLQNSMQVKSRMSNIRKTIEKLLLNFTPPPCQCRKTPRTAAISPST